MRLWERCFSENPLVAILRGLDPGQAVAVSDHLVENGFRIIEVPLNSPDPLRSIESIAARHGNSVIVGAGTVLETQQVVSVADAGGQIIVAPNLSPAVGAEALNRRLVWAPGVLSPTEAFEALTRGAAMLKFFPAELIPPRGIAAMRAVLPGNARIAVVGGVTPDSMSDYLMAGADGFGLGSALFRPGFELSDIARRAAEFTRTIKALRGQM